MSSSKRRPRAPQGEGARLRTELLAAAERLLESHGPSAVTLRAVAREVGVAAPSVYLHFESIEDLMKSLLAERFAELDVQVTAAIANEVDPAGRLRAGCAAYCAFAMNRPSAYDVMFGGHIHRLTQDAGIGRDSFLVLVEAVVAAVGGGVVRQIDPFVLARRIWVGMHGMVSLRSRLPEFPWDPVDQAIDQLLSDVAGLDIQPKESKVPNRRK